MVEVGREFEGPCEAEEEIEDDGDVVELFRGQIEARSEGVGGIVFGGGREKGEIPIFGYVPVEGVEGVDKDADEPESV